MLAAFVIAYSIQGITWLFVYCTPYSGWWEFQWMNPFDPRCHDFELFVDLTYWNIGELSFLCFFSIFLFFSAFLFFSVFIVTALTSSTACNIFTDVILGALPIPVIWRLRMKLRVRLYVIAILNLGYL